MYETYRHTLHILFVYFGVFHSEWYRKMELQNVFLQIVELLHMWRIASYDGLRSPWTSSLRYLHYTEESQLVQYRSVFCDATGSDVGLLYRRTRLSCPNWLLPRKSASFLSQNSPRRIAFSESSLS